MRFFQRLLWGFLIVFTCFHAAIFASNNYIRESFSELPKDVVFSAEQHVSLVDGRLSERALMIRDGQVEWDLGQIREDVLIEFWFYPENWDAFSKARATICKFRVGKDYFELSKPSDRDELNITSAGETLFSYPIYNIYPQPWMDRTKKDLWQHVLICVSDGSLYWSVNGFVVEPTRLVQTNGCLNKVTLVGQPANRFSGFNVTGASWKSLLPTLRDRYLALFKGEPLIKENLITVPKVNKLPQIDGEFDEVEWSDAVVVSNFTSLKNQTLCGEDVKLYLAYDDDNLYMAVKTPYKGELDAQKWGKRDMPLYLEESYEIFFSQNLDGSKSYWQFIGNPYGDQYDHKLFDAKWNAEWTWETSNSDEMWVAEFRGGFQELEMLPPGNFSLWGFNIFNTKADLSWSWARAYNDLSSFGTLRFENNAPIIQVDRIRLENRNIIFPMKIKTLEQAKNLIIGIQYFFPGDILPNIEEVKSVSIDSNSEANFELMLSPSTVDRGRIAFYIREGNEDLYYYSTSLPESPKIIRQGSSPKNESTTTVKKVLTEKDLAYERTWTAEELGETLLENTLWQENDLGYSNVVPEPWVPMEYSEQMVECWGRKYIYSNSLLPSQIVSQGKKLFLSSPRFVLSNEDKTYTFSQATVDIQKVSDALILVVTEAVDGPYKLKLITEYEFDGMGKVELSLSSLQPSVKVENLYLEMPLDASRIKLFHYASGAGIDIPYSNSGEVTKEGFCLDEFKEILWLGDYDVGFCWFAEGMKDWQLKDENGIQVVEPENNGVQALKIKLADRPFILKQALKLIFGIQATPYKERKANWRDINDINSIKWSWTWGDGGSYPFHDTYPEKAREDVEKARQQGKEVMPYGSLYYFGSQRFHYGSFGEVSHPGMILREMLIWGNLWRTSPPKIDVSIPQKHTAPGDWFGKQFQPWFDERVCSASSFQDWYIWKLNQVINDTCLGAFYLDQPLYRCSNPAHGCGYINYKGDWVGSTPIFAMRNMAKRIYNLFYQKHGRTQIKLHSSNQLIIPVMSFADTWWDGEAYIQGQMKVKEFYSKLLTSERLQAQNFGKPIGFAPDFLPEFEVRFAPTIASIKDMMGLFMVHDSTVFPGWSNNDYLIQWIQMKRLENLTDDMNRIYYWETDNRLKVTDDDVKYILEYNREKALLILFNWNDHTSNINIKLELSDLGLPENITIKDVIVEKTLFSHNTGDFDISIQPRDFRMLLVTQKK